MFSSSGLSFEIANENGAGAFPFLAYNKMRKKKIKTMRKGAGVCMSRVSRFLTATKKGKRRGVHGTNLKKKG